MRNAKGFGLIPKPFILLSTCGKINDCIQRSASSTTTSPFSLFHCILPSMPQYFTLSEANQELITIRPLMDEVQAIRQKIMSTQPEAWTAIEKSVGNGGSRSLSKIVQDFEKLDGLVHQILDTGVLIKDVNIGLLDFPALRNGYEVYLCWQHGEDDIAYWHEVDAGFAGRQPIDSF